MTANELRELWWSGATIGIYVPALLVVAIIGGWRLAMRQARRLQHFGVTVAQWQAYDPILQRRPKIKSKRLRPAKVLQAVGQARGRS